MRNLYRLKRTPRGDEEGFPVLAAETEIRGRFRHQNFPNQQTVWRKNMDAVACARPNAASVVAADSVRPAIVDDTENFSIGEGSILLHLENAEVMRGDGVGDV